MKRFITGILVGGACTVGGWGQTVAHAGSEAKPKQADILRFAVVSQAFSAPTTLAEKACPVVAIDKSGAEGSKPVTVDPKVLDAITTQLESKISGKMAVVVEERVAEAAPGTLVISGCVTRASSGNGAERMVGFELGASHLEAHVQIHLKTDEGLKLLDEYDIAVKGGSLLPPLGPIGVGIHAAKEFRETMTTNAKKLANQSLKKMQKDTKDKSNQGGGNS